MAFEHLEAHGIVKPGVVDTAVLINGILYPTPWFGCEAIEGNIEKPRFIFFGRFKIGFCRLEVGDGVQVFDSKIPVLDHLFRTDQQGVAGKGGPAGVG